VSIGTIAESSTTPGTFTVEVTPTTAGTLVLRVKEGAEVKDVAGNELDTDPAIEDDTTVTVGATTTQITSDSPDPSPGERR
jgi:hypothetical protein